jgi:hypothetical protein
MPTILVIGDKFFRIENVVEAKLIEWSQAPRTAIEVDPATYDKAGRLIRELQDIAFPPKKRVVPKATPNTGSQKSNPKNETSDAKFEMEDGKE